jgi:hypothetical protein
MKVGIPWTLLNVVPFLGVFIEALAFAVDMVVHNTD